MATTVSSTPPRVGELAPDFSLDSTYDVLDDERCFARRASLLIDRCGVIRWFHMEDHLRHRRQADELLAKVAALD